MKKDLLIIIPVYNEEQNIKKVLSSLEENGVSQIADILIINDGSNDSTYSIVKSSPYNVISHLYNMGYGYALQTGYKYAMRYEYKYLIQMDGDTQHDVSNIAIIYQKLKEVDENGESPDIVLGTRFLDNPTRFSVPFFKKIAYSLLCNLIHLITGKYISDPTTGLQGMNRKVFEYYSEYNNFDDKYPDANILIQMLLLNFRVIEVTAVMHPRKEGESMHKGILKPAWYMVRSFYSIFTIIIQIKFLKIKN